MTAQPGHGEHAWLVIRNDYNLQVGSPRIAEFSVYVDGRFAGSALLGGSFRTAVAPGAHTLRIRTRYWYYYSKRLTVNIDQGETLLFGADIPTFNNKKKGMMRLIYDPLHSLVLEVVKNGS